MTCPWCGHDASGHHWQCLVRDEWGVLACPCRRQPAQIDRRNAAPECPSCGHPTQRHKETRSGVLAQDANWCRTIIAGRWPVEWCDCARTTRQIEDEVVGRLTRPNRPAIPQHVRRAVIDRDGYVCQRCGCRVYTGGRGRRWPRRRLTLDHIHPYSLNGPDTVENLRVLCQRCNSSKHDKITESATSPQSFGEPE